MINEKCQMRNGKSIGTRFWDNHEFDDLLLLTILC